MHVDAAIATLFCIGAFTPQISAIGGRFLITLQPRNGVSRQTRNLDAQEVESIAATEDLFKGKSTISQRDRNSIQL
ncbi:hypothetical protein DAPPUDRAFT_262546 [Daphnia pulex]|uniref:Uncharacterized protein n=1 Tax=Daphnia pulex TaxID=6669 RepID=E9HN69_DAPPU|nr:hypothetical protein DAPPUDRAFT_262546 [Daphnia pulex]|eukprot:EFX66785.1 hypothetical protein DAPPUDRAFT_262546 [Daphnia pulex]